MNKHQLIEALLLKVSDSLTTTRLGLQDGRIAIEDVAKVFENAEQAMSYLRIISKAGLKTMTDGEQNALQEVFDRILMG